MSSQHSAVQMETARDNAANGDQNNDTVRALEQLRCHFSAFKNLANRSDLLLEAQRASLIETCGIAADLSSMAEALESSKMGQCLRNFESTSSCQKPFHM